MSGSEGATGDDAHDYDDHDDHHDPDRRRPLPLRRRRARRGERVDDRDAGYVNHRRDASSTARVGRADETQAAPGVDDLARAGVTGSAPDSAPRAHTPPRLAGVRGLAPLRGTDAPQDHASPTTPYPSTITISYKLIDHSPRSSRRRRRQRLRGGTPDEAREYPGAEVDVDVRLATTTRVHSRRRSETTEGVEAVVRLGTVESVTCAADPEELGLTAQGESRSATPTARRGSDMRAALDRRRHRAVPAHPHPRPGLAGRRHREASARITIRHRPTTPAPDQARGCSGCVTGAPAAGSARAAR